jgi:TonB family protein
MGWGVERGLHVFHGILRYAGGRGGLSGNVEGRKTMKNNSRKIRGLLAGAVLVAACAGLSVAQEVTSSRKVLKAVAAQYPSVLKRRGIGGTVKLRVLVNPNGSVKDVQVLGGNPILSDCAVKAVKQWVFVTSEKEESIEISVGFDPNSSSE